MRHFPPTAQVCSASCKKKDNAEESCCSGRRYVSTPCMTTATLKKEEEEDVKPESIKKEAIVVVNSQKKGSFCGTVVQSSPMAEVKDDVIVKKEEPVKANVGCSDSGGGGSFGF
ncbi:hypothetical protein LOK49_LG01G02425 [Camellia lanceoleosa]|uniref:Uncharacterized protein n=1 Tax=Camellia lanceoleosa TaxID=1840588 RepID=A0ACC0J1K9_9ERIC|nr:hypothetical protein LOK49_LG01G02425 [Camellia lanceoleosa]